MVIILARPRGFCDGVVRAIQVVEQVLLSEGAPVYVLHEIVHNRHVVEDLRQRAIFVEKIEEIPAGAFVIFSAHGVPDDVVRQAKERNLRAVDATGPLLVKKVHARARRYSREGREVIIIGHQGHPEVEGTKGCIEGIRHVVPSTESVAGLAVKDPDALAYVTQTTLNLQHTSEIIGALKRRFPNISGPGLKDICYATQSRQEAVHRLARDIDLLLVVGSRNSSNSNRLREVGEGSGCPSYLIEDAGDVDPGWLTKGRYVGVTAGASAPEVLVQGVVERLRALGATGVQEMVEEPDSGQPVHGG